MAVLQLLVEAQPGTLLELLVAANEVTGVRVVLGVSVYVFGQILLLGKVAPAHIAHKALESHV